MFNLNVRVTDDNPNTRSWNLEGDIGGKASFKDFSDYVKSNLIRISKDVLKEEQKKGFDAEPRIRVDGRFEKPIDNVHPFGRIEFFARTEAAQGIKEIYQEIVSRSPEGTGLYKNSNYVIYNNRLVAKNLGELSQFLIEQSNEGFGSGDIIRFINVTPYARKLEYLGLRKDTEGTHGGRHVQKVRGRKNKKTGRLKSAPNGAYYMAYKAAARLKHISGFLKFAFIPGGAFGITIQPQAGLRTTYSSKGKYAKSAGRPYLYPSIVFSLSSKGAINRGASLVQ